MKGIWVQHWAMSMRILAEQLNGETFELEVTAEMTMREVKRLIKSMHKWEDELSRDTTVVDLIIGDKKVTNEETVEELGLCEDSKVTVVFRKNMVQCSHQSGFGPDLDPDVLVIVEIPDSETEIKPWAFRNCRRLAKVIIPSSVTQIGYLAFHGCSALAVVNIPDSVTQITDYAFAFCSSLLTINIPDSVTQIGEGAFARCSSLVSVNIPSSVKQIESFAFDNCGSLTSVNIQGDVTYMALDAFLNCKQLTLTAPARLLGPHVLNVYKVVAKECGCGRCDWEWFLEGWLCPMHCSTEAKSGELVAKRPRLDAVAGEAEREQSMVFWECAR